MIDMKTFISVMSEYARTGKYPNIEFKDNNSLKDVVKRIDGGFVEIPATLTGDQVINEILNKVNDAQGDEMIAAKGFEVLDEIAKNMAATIDTTRTTIRAIKQTSQDLAKRIEKLYDVLIKTEGLGTTKLNLVAEKGTYTPIDWSLISKLAPSKFIVSEMNTLVNIQADAPSKTALNPLQVHFRDRLAKASDVFKEVSLEDNAKTELFDLLKSKTSIVDSDINKYIKIITTKTAAMTFARKMIGYIKTINNTGDACLAILNLIDDFNKLENVMANNDVVLTADMKTNFEFVKKYLTPAAYFVIVCRTIACKEAILLDNKMINPDKQAEADRAGITETDISVHLYYMNTNPTLPASGIALNSVVAFKEKLAVRKEKDQAQNGIKIKFETNTVRRKAAGQTLRTYIRENLNKDDIVASANAEALINRACDNLLLDNVSCEDIIFKFLLDLTHGNDYTALVYKSLGASYLNTLTQKETVGDEDILIAETGVFIKLVIEFIMTNFCK